MKISWRDWDVLTSMGRGIVLKLIAGCEVSTTIDLLKIKQGGIGMRVSWRDRDMSISIAGGGMNGIVLKLRAGCGISTASNLLKIK